MRFLLALILGALVACSAVFIYAGHLPGPSIEISKPAKYVGISTPVEVHVTAPQGQLTKLDVVFEQNGKQTPVFSLDKAAADKSATLQVAGGNAPTGAVLTSAIGRQNVPDLKSGPGRIIVTQARERVDGRREL